MEIDGVYFYIIHENGNCIIKLVKDIDWEVIFIHGVEPIDLPYEFDKEELFDDILKQMKYSYDYFIEIEKDDIKDYI